MHLLLVLVPLGLAAAVSPMMLTEQTVLLGGPHGRRTSLLYAAGTAAVLVVLVGAVLLLGRSLSLPTNLHLDATLDLVIGGVLTAAGVALYLWRPGRDKERKASRAQPGVVAAFGFGMFSMATNLTSLALVVPAAKEIAADPVETWQRLVAGLLLVALACLPAWGPVVLDAAAPTTAGRVLDRTATWIRRHGELLAALFLGAAGLFLVARGLLRLLGL